MSDAEPLDVVVIGAGFAGLYMVCRLREQGFAVHGFERGDVSAASLAAWTCARTSPSARK
jgi:cation diffusion facilitator CzcD-associated flavoprotein CzcO